MASLQKQLQDAISLGQKDKAPAFVALIPQILSSGTAVAPGLHSLVDTVVNQDSVGLVVGRQVLSEITKVLSEKAIADDELRKEVIQDIINVVQPRIVSYEEQVSIGLN
jgi:COP9 signalosome complex subunit 4